MDEKDGGQGSEPGKEGRAFLDSGYSGLTAMLLLVGGVMCDGSSLGVDALADEMMMVWAALLLSESMPSAPACGFDGRKEIERCE